MLTTRIDDPDVQLPLYRTAIALSGQGHPIKSKVRRLEDINRQLWQNQNEREQLVREFDALEQEVLRDVQNLNALVQSRLGTTTPPQSHH